MRVVLKVKCRSLTGVVAVTILSLAAIFLFGGKTAIAAGNPELSFEGKIVNTAGTNITDGTYNMEFKIYTGCTNNLGAGCTAVWTEDWLVSGAGGSSPVTFTSGTFQVNLGSITAFGGSVPWDTSPLYLSLNIGNTSASCVPAGNFNGAVSCGADGVMSPYILLTSTPYAQDSAELGGLASTAFGQLASNQTWTGANTFQPTTNVSSLIAEQATGSPTADIFDVEGNGGAADEFINVTSTAANAGAVTIKALGGTTTGNGITLLAGTAGGAANTGGAVAITAGTGSTSGAGGQASLQGGVGGTNGNGGVALIQGGTAGSTSGTGGEVEVIGGSGSTATGGGPGGELLLEGGLGTGTGANAGGAVQIQAGTASSSGAPAAITLQTVGETEVIAGSSTAPSDTLKTSTNSATAYQIQNADTEADFVADTTATTNYITDADFSVGSNTCPTNGGFTDWAVIGSPTTDCENVTPTDTYEGQNSLELVTTAVAGEGVSTTSFSQTPTTAASGTNYTVSFDVMQTAGASQLPASDFEVLTTVTSGVAPTCTGSALTTFSTSGFETVSCTLTGFTAVGSISTLKIEDINASVDTFYIDDIQLQSGTVATAFQIGNLQLAGVITNPIALRNITNSTTAFQIQNSAGSNLVDVDTLDGRVGIANSAPAFPLDVVGVVNSSVGLDIGGTPYCSTTLVGCTPAAGSGSYVQIDPATSPEEGDMTLQGDGSGATATLWANPDVATDILDLDNLSGAPLTSVSNHGAISIETNAPESEALQLENQEGNDLLLANTGITNMVKNPTTNTSGAVTNWTEMGTITGGAPTGDTSNPLEGLASIEAVVGATATSGMKTATFTSPMNPTTEYQLTFFAKCSTSIATFSYGRQDVSGTTPGGDVSTGACNTNWQQYTLNFTTGATMTTPNIFMNSGTSTSLDIWVDAVTLQQVSVNQANSYDPGDLYLNGTVVNPAIFENQANSTQAFQVQNSSSTDLLNVDTVNDVIQVGSQVASSNSTLLVLNSYNTYADPTTPSACGASTDLGGLYYNTASNTIRACINGGWQDLVSNQALGLLAFGVVSTSGTNPGDLNAVTTAQVTGPCKVSEGSSGVTDITVQPCTVYSGGREIVYAGITNVALSSFTNPLAASKYANLCFSNAAGTAPANTLQLLSSNTTPILAGLPTMTASAPIECIATLRADATANNLSTVYDTRTFTDSSKEFADAGVALGDGYIAITNGATEGVTDTATAVTAGIMGVVVASNGSTSTGAPNVIISTGGPAEVLNFTTIATLGDVVETGSVIGDAEAINAVGTAGAKNYEMLGIGENAAAAAQDTAACGSVATCQGSIYTDVNIAF